MCKWNPLLVQTQHCKHGWGDAKNKMSAIQEVPSPLAPSGLRPPLPTNSHLRQYLPPCGRYQTCSSHPVASRVLYQSTSTDNVASHTKDHHSCNAMDTNLDTYTFKNTHNPELEHSIRMLPQNKCWILVRVGLISSSLLISFNLVELVCD